MSGRAADVVDCSVDRRAGESLSEARRAVAEGGAYINNVRITRRSTTSRRRDDLLHGRYLVLRRGKRVGRRVYEVARPDLSMG